ncbi:MAG: flagellar basal body P-ring protein FlgI [Phycisphaerae bacterium]
MRRAWLISVLCLLAMPGTVWAGVTARVGDVTDLKGQGVNYLTGMGLVVGLDGTGDGDEYALTMRPLAKALEFYANPVGSMEELADTKNVAIVFLSARLPAHGAREGSRINVEVSAIGKCKSLAGGMLLPAPLLYPDRRVNEVFALCQGKVQLPDAEIPTGGVVEGGAVIQQDVIHSFLALGRDLPFSNTWIQPGASYVTLVVDDVHASWTLAREIVQAVDSALALAADVDHVAMAVDPKNVLVLVPQSEVNAPADWISQIEGLDLLISDGQARVVINRTTGTISVSGNATLSPVIVSHQGLTISVAQPPADGEPAPAQPQLQNFVPLDPTSSGGTSLSDLTRALNRMNVPVEDRIAILTQIHELGALHAKLVFED